MKEYALMMLVTVIAVRLLWIEPMCRAFRERPMLVMGIQNDTDEGRDDTDGNNHNEETTDC